ESSKAPPDMDLKERGQEETAPEKERSAKLGGPPNDKEGLEQAELIACDQPADSADVGEGAGEVIDLARGFEAGALILDESERWQQVFARGEFVQVDEFLLGQAGVYFGEGLRFGAVDEEEAGGDEEGG